MTNSCLVFTSTTKRTTLASIRALLWVPMVMLLAGCSGLAQAGGVSGKVVGVKDGDTIVVLTDGISLNVRLSDIDAPEHGQQFGNRAKQALSHLVFNKLVRLDINGVDHYGRSIARVFQDGLDINLEMVKEGYAWAFLRYTRDPSIKAAEATARQQGKGLWAMQSPTAPWTFRRGNHE